MRANPARNCAFSGRPRTFVLLNGSVAHKGLFHAGRLRSNCILRSLIVCRNAGPFSEFTSTWYPMVSSTAP